MIFLRYKTLASQILPKFCLSQRDSGTAIRITITPDTIPDSAAGFLIVFTKSQHSLEPDSTRFFIIDIDLKSVKDIPNLVDIVGKLSGFFKSFGSYSYPDIQSLSFTTSRFMREDPMAKCLFTAFLNAIFEPKGPLDAFPQLCDIEFDGCALAPSCERLTPRSFSGLLRSYMDAHPDRNFILVIRNGLDTGNHALSQLLGSPSVTYVQLENCDLDIESFPVNNNPSMRNIFLKGCTGLPLTTQLKMLKDRFSNLHKFSCTK